jgi:hypothetical protein
MKSAVLCGGTSEERDVSPLTAARRWLPCALPAIVGERICRLAIARHRERISLLAMKDNGP